MVRKDNLVIEGIGKANFVATNGISKVNFATKIPLYLPFIKGEKKEAGLKPCPTNNKSLLISADVTSEEKRNSKSPYNPPFVKGEK